MLGIILNLFIVLPKKLIWRWLYTVLSKTVHESIFGTMWYCFCFRF